MKLDELHVRHPAAGTPGHGDTVAGGSVWIGRIEIDFAGAAGGNQSVLSAECQHLSGGVIQYVGTVAAPLPAPAFRR
jgi:hypothetical protein